MKSEIQPIVPEPLRIVVEGEKRIYLCEKHFQEKKENQSELKDSGVIGLGASWGCEKCAANVN